MRGSALLSSMMALAVLGSLTAFLMGYISHSLKLAQNSTHIDRAKHRAYHTHIELDDWHSPTIGKSGRFSFDSKVQLVSARQTAGLLYLTSAFSEAVQCQTPNNLEVLSSLSPMSLRASYSCLEINEADPKVLGNLTIESGSTLLNGPAIFVSGAVIIDGELRLNQNTLIFALGDMLFDSILNVADEPLLVNLISLTGKITIHSVSEGIDLKRYEGGVDDSSGKELFGHELIVNFKRELLILGFKTGQGLE